MRFDQTARHVFSASFLRAIKGNHRMTTLAYNSTFYRGYNDASINAAREIVPFVQSVVNPKSVVDVGCGTGTWLQAWMELGVDDILGIDGHYVPTSDLRISQDRFKAMDLSAPDESVTTQFDLVQSLEVAEHLPHQAADAFISFLCSLGPAVMFSAAIPYQGGTNHINEQWPEYWADKFTEHNYVVMDIIRPRVWNNPNVAYYYAQNTFVFVRADHVALLSRLQQLSIAQAQGSLSRVHPRKWLEKNEQPIPLEQIIGMLPKSGLHLIMRSLRTMQRILEQP